MPKNKATGKANRQALTADKIFKFCEDKYLKMFNLKRVKKKGNQALQLREEERQQEASGSGDSPSTTLAPLGALFLDSPSPEEPSSESPSQDQSTPFGAPPSPSLAHAQPIQHHQEPSPTDNSQATVTARLSALESGLEAFRRDVERRLKAAGL